MSKNELLEKILSEPMENSLRNNLLRYLFKDPGDKSKGIPRLKVSPGKLNSEDTYARMIAAAGKTGASVARVLDISPQGFSNQKARNSISGSSIIDFHLKTGVSLDWLVGSWDGSSDNYCSQWQSSDVGTVSVTNNTNHKYLSLVEIYDQQSGNVELKWCLTQHRVCFDNDNIPVSGDFSALYSIIIRYKDESGTPDKVKSRKKHHFQVRKVLAYVLGAPKIIRQLDAQAKNITVKYTSGQLERPGKTEFRLYSAKDVCLNVLSFLAEQNGLAMIEPKNNTIAWDFLIGTSCMSPRDWLLNKLRQSLEMHETEQILPVIATVDDHLDDFSQLSDLVLTENRLPYSPLAKI